MKQRFAILITVLIALLGQCRKETQVTFDNPNDPNNPETFRPAKPNGLTITPLDTTLQLVWADSSNFEDGYLVEWQSLAATEWVTRMVLPANTTRWVDQAPPSLSIRYRVSAFRGSGDAKTFKPGPTAEIDNKPNIISANSISSRSVRISWRVANAFHSAIELQLNENGTGWRTVGSAARSDTALAFTLDKSYSGKTVVFRMLAKSATAVSTPSNERSVSFALIPPSGLQLTPVDTTMLLTWTPGNADRFLVQWQRPSDNTWQNRIELEGQTHTWRDPEPPSLTISYRIVPNSTEFLDQAIAASFNGRPTIITTRAWSASQIRIGWRVTTPIHKSVIIERSENGINWQAIGQAGRLDTAAIFDLGSDMTNKNVSVRVKAAIGSRYSDPSDARMVSFSLLPPTNIQLAFTSDSTAVLQWQQANRLHTMVDCQFREGTGLWSEIKSIGLDTLQCVFKKPTFLQGTSYTARIRTRSGTNVSEWAETTAMFDVGSISGVQYQILSENRIRLDWNYAGSLAKEFAIYRSVNNSLPVKVLTIQNTAQRFIELTNQQLANGNRYIYTVQPKSDRVTGTGASTAEIAFVFAAPTTITLASSSATEATFAWTNNAMGVQRIDILRAPAADTTTWTTLAELQPGATSYRAQNLGTAPWYFKVLHRGDVVTVQKTFKLIPSTKVPVVTKLFTLGRHKSAVTSVAISKNGRIIVTGSNDDSVRIWRMATGEIIRTVNAGADVNAVGISPDTTNFAASTNSTLKLWNTNTGTQLWSRSGEWRGISYHPSGLSMAVGGYDLYQIRVSDGAITYSNGSLTYSRGVAHTSDGKNVLASYSYTLYLIDASSFVTQKTIGNGTTILDISVNPNNTLVASNGYSTRNAIFLRNLPNLDTARVYRQTPSIFTLDFSPDGAYLAFGGGESNLKIIRTADVQLVGNFQGHIGNINSVRWSPSGNRIVSGSDDATAIVWNVSLSATAWQVEQ